jgi:Flp pilus assembly secretin CpaC
MLIIIPVEVYLFSLRKRRLTLRKENMKIFLTEIEAYGTTFAGPNIVASSYEKAEIAAAQNHLVVVGELDSIYVDDELEKEHLNTIPKEEDRTIH